MSERDPIDVRLELLEKAIKESRELIRIAQMGLNPAIHRDWFDRAAVFMVVTDKPMEWSDNPLAGLFDDIPPHPKATGSK